METSQKNRARRPKVLNAPPLWRKVAVRAALICYDVGFYLLFLGMVAAGIYGYTVTDELVQKFEGRRWKIAGHVYSDSLTLYPGVNIHTAGLKDRLLRMNYQEADGEIPRQGEFKSAPNHFDVYLRDFQYPNEKRQGYWLRMALDGGRIDSMFNMSERKAIFSAEAEPELIGRFFGTDREERELVSYDAVSPYLINAIVAIEDNSFFTHHGVNVKGILRMVLVNLRHMKLVQGGSSLTQQLVKNFYLTSERSLQRKLKEAVMAMVLEMLYTKEEIFECYLNEVYFGQSGSVSVCGAGEAAKFYFGKDVRSLDLAEAALLAGLIRSPEGYNPRSQVDRAKQRRDYILKRMAKQGLISKEQAEAAVRKEIKVQRHTPTYTIAPYFIEFLKKQLGEKYSPDVLISEGLNIFTTLDAGMQRKAEAAVKEGLAELEAKHERLRDDPNHPLQAALVVIEPQTGYIRAMVGGRDFMQSQYNRAVQSLRQTGSVFKPFVYCAGFVMAEKDKLDFRATDMVDDSPFQIQSGGRNWAPQNYNKKFLGPVTVRNALEHSMNVPTVKLAMKVGIKNIIETAREMGIETKLPPYPSLALGSADLSLIEVASAYSTLAALGSRAEPMSVRDVVNPQGEVLTKKTMRVKRAIPARAAYLTVNLMKGVFDRGTARRARSEGFTLPAAGKTGTTDEYRDAWFVGFTPEVLCAVWVGFDQEKNVRLAGASAALPIWLRFMKAQLAGGAPSDWEPPSGIVFHKVDYETGKIAVYGCPNVIEEAFLEGREQEEECKEHKDDIVEFFKKKFE